ncbi:MAG: GIY-YIG nuclease family protein [Candidatus Nezhaarchaeota archaeon]|nr:GIY-YIG nuclease family protein [Candidatus Nezhaarchaeota archaeon]MCX8142214.1 GIY-YIG nuclease family protein [Candidatus Nezhaarchaeota archaeon]MDW8050813.1 GIY-YIG nuclease family protein [Nitrososphaerota archaeon]
MICNPGPDHKDDVNRLNEPPITMLPEKGVYTIILHVKRSLRIHVGSLGIVGIKRGFYAYTGSGLGRGALSLRGRLLRHLRKDKKLRWHIDYLTSLPTVKVVGVVASRAEKELECIVASRLGKSFRCIEGFGSSDCSCTSHLALLACKSWDECLIYVENVYKKLGLVPVSMRL